MGIWNEAFSEQGPRHNTDGVQFAAFLSWDWVMAQEWKQTISPGLADLRETSIPLPQNLVYSVGRLRVEKSISTSILPFAFFLNRTVRPPRQDECGKDHLDWECFLADPFTPRAVSWTNFLHCR